MANQDISQALASLKIVDLGRGMAAALAAKLLAELGGNVARFEPLAGDPFYAHYPAYRAWHSRAAIARVANPQVAQVAMALHDADLCIIGGEDFPGLDWPIDATELGARYPQLVILEITGALQDGGAPVVPAVELLAQARSGLVFEQHADRPVQLAFAPASYCAALHGVTALLAGLCHRARGGPGQIVRTSLGEGAITLGTQYWITASTPATGFNFAIPKDPWPLIFRCRDGRYVHFVLGSVGSKGSVYRILGIDDSTVKPQDSGMPNPFTTPKNFFGDIDVLAAHVARIDSADLMPQLQAAGVAANYVMAPGECWDDPQVAHHGTIVADAAAGRYVGLPMRGTLSTRSVKPETFPPAPASLPLQGIRVLDFGLFVAGPYAGVTLADLGADVIKIETPQGDPNRAIFRSYAAANRGKRTLTVDLKTADGRAIAAELIDSAQVVLNNFRPGVSARLGVDPATLHARDPDKIVLEATGFGRSGPCGEQPGFDMIFQALCGHEVRAGGLGGNPAWDRTAMVDYVMGLLDQVAVLVGLWRRFSGRGGADLDVSLLDSGLFLMSELTQAPDGTFFGAPPLNAAQTGFHPAEALYACADGWIAIAARGEAMAKALADALGVAAPPRDAWADPEQRAIAAALAARSVGEAIALLDQAGVWAVVACPSGDRAMRELARIDPAIEVVSANPVHGEVRQPGSLFRMGPGRNSGSGGAPAPGEHTRQILSELGYDTLQVANFFAAKVVA